MRNAFTIATPFSARAQIDGNGAMLRKPLKTVCLLVTLLATPLLAQGQKFQSVKDCAVGRRVEDNAGRKGTITKVDLAWSYCTVRFDDGQEMSMLYSLLRLAGAGGAELKAAKGQQLQSVKECVVGKKVTNSTGRKGTITKVDLAWSYCTVRYDDNGQEESMLYSLWRAADGVGLMNVAVGTYECVTGGGQTGMILRITAANTYSVEGRTGRFRMDPSGQIIFETGPMAGQFHAKLLPEGRIGLNLDGGSFYNTSCELNRTLQ